MTENMNLTLNLAHDYLDRADVVILMDAYWFYSTVENLANNKGVELTDEELDVLVETLMAEY